MKKGSSRPRNVTATVYERLRSDVLKGVFKPGERLRIETLRDAYGVSGSPLREALARLVAEGFVLQFDQRGFRVADVSLESFEELTRTRSWIHEIALRESITNGDAAWEERIVLTHHWLSRTPGRNKQELFDPEWERGDAGLLWQERHRAFHSALLSGCNSKLLQDFADTLFDRALRYNPVAIPALKIENRDIDAEHQEIVQAVLSRDLPSAIRLLDNHIGLTRIYLRDAIAPVRKSVQTTGR
jgi:DNA-binding GntR family transcriptional regulator